MNVEIKAWLKNTLIFVAPDLIIFFGALASKLSAEGAFIAVLILNLAIDLLRKYLSSRKGWKQMNNFLIGMLVGILFGIVVGYWLFSKGSDIWKIENQ